MIGGANQTGLWKLDARYNKSELIARIETIARYRDRIHLSSADAATFLSELLPSRPKNAILYLDPPYYVKGRRRLYSNFYEHTDHAEIAAVIAKARCPWIVSYDDVREVRALYSGFRRIRYEFAYSALARYNGAEVLFLSHELKLPRRARPNC